MNIQAKIKNLKRTLAKSRGLDPQDHLESEAEEQLENEIEQAESAAEDRYDEKYRGDNGRQN